MQILKVGYLQIIEKQWDGLLLTLSALMCQTEIDVSVNDKEESTMEIKRIEGILDHHACRVDPIGGNIVFEGYRYLLKGYFRFGSSGAPYLIYDTDSDSFMINAVQSEGSPIQLSINNNKEGNFQYINAIASPLLTIQDALKGIINSHT